MPDDKTGQSVRILDQRFMFCLFDQRIKDQMIAGSRVTQQITPMITPFAITIPRFLPSANVIRHRAAKPATVVMELDTMDLKVLDIA